MEHFLHHLAVHVSKEPEVLLKFGKIIASNPGAALGVAAVAGIGYLVVKACE